MKQESKTIALCSSIVGAFFVILAALSPTLRSDLSRSILIDIWYPKMPDHIELYFLIAILCFSASYAWYRDWRRPSNNERVSKKRGRSDNAILIPILLVCLSGLAVYFTLVILSPLFELHSTIDIRGIEDWFRALPLSSNLYALVGIFFLVHLVWYRYDLRKLIAKYQGARADTLSDRDWSTVIELRKRSVSFGSRARMMLFGVFALLVGGLYFAVFGVRSVISSDAISEVVAPLKEDFERRFRESLGLVEHGRHWFQVLDIGEGGVLGVLADSAIAIGQSQIHVTRDGGVTWSSDDLILDESAKIVHVEFLRHDDSVIITADDGSVAVTTDGLTWRVIEEIKLSDSEWVVYVEFSEDGDAGIIVGDGGSVYVTHDGGTTWSELERLSLDDAERIDFVKFADDFGTGIIVGHEGSVYVTHDGGTTWSEPEGLSLDDAEWIDFVKFADDFGTGIIVGDEGSVYVTHDGGTTWDEPEGLSLDDAEWIEVVKFSDDFGTGIIVGDEGSVYVTHDGGTTWGEPEGLSLDDAEWIDVVKFADDFGTGIIVGHEGSVYVTDDGGTTWSEPAGLPPNGSPPIYLVQYSPSGSIGMILAADGSTYISFDYGISWELSGKMSLRDHEFIHFLGLQEHENYTAVALGDEGTVHVIGDTQSGWRSTEREDSSQPFRHVEFDKTGSLIGIDVMGRVYVLFAIPRVGELLGKSFEVMQSMIENDYMFPSESRLREEIVSFVDNAVLQIAVAAVEPFESEGSTGYQSLFPLFDVSREDQLRAVTLVIVFFLVRLLVRLYQYCTRLASFWDSRADAILLADSFSVGGSASFDDLVSALAPDEYDFMYSPGQRGVHKSYQEAKRK